MFGAWDTYQLTAGAVHNGKCLNLSMPLRESPHESGLMEDGTRMEAAVDQARTHLQVQPARRQAFCPCICMVECLPVLCRWTPLCSLVVHNMYCSPAELPSSLAAAASSKAVTPWM